MSNLYLSLLGAPRIECDGASIHISRHKAIALLVYLAVTGQPHRRDALAVLLWPEQDQSSARASLRRALAALREALGDRWLDADRESVNLNWDAGIELDVRVFRQRLVGCAAHCHTPREDSKTRETCAACMSMLAEAADLYGGDFLTGFTLRDSPAFDDWQFFQTQGLRDELAGALERLVNGHSARGEFEQAIPHARRWLALDPLHEPAHRWLIQLYAWADQRAAALRQYEQCAQILEDELGASPEEETVALYQAIVEHRELPSPVSGNLVSTQRKHNLPAQITPFVGREATLSEIGERLADPDCRLLTLVGPGGSGKTRLALEAASRRLDGYLHGVFFVSLAPLDAVESIVPAVAQALAFSFHGEGESKAQLLAYLRSKHMLLVLDNYEHLLEGATLAAEILQAAPQVVILATSRVGLHVQGEHRFLVQGMDVPTLTPPVNAAGGPSPKSERAELGDAAQYSAVKLFLSAARRRQSDFALTAENRTDIVRICRLVEGMPLGILLAAAWVALVTPGEIADEIVRGLDFLESDRHDVPARQRSLRATFDYSWSLLAEREREAFAALSVFRGGFAREAAQDIAGVSLHGLMGLADKSLIHRTSGGRYELHELMRQYAADKLAASLEIEQAVRDRHCTYYAAALQRWDAELKGPRQLAALAEIAANLGNARAAWDWAVAQGHVQELDRAMDGLCRFYEWRGRYEEGDEACRVAIETLDTPPDIAHPSFADGMLGLRARATAWRGGFNLLLGRPDQARRLLEESLAQLETLVSTTGQEIWQAKAFALLHLARTLILLGDRKAGAQRYEESLVLYRALGDRWGTATALCHLADTKCLLDTPKEARPLARESLVVRQELGDLRGIASSLRVLGFNAQCLGQFEECHRLADESAAAFQAVGDHTCAAQALVNAAFGLMYSGDFVRARARLEKSIATLRDLAFGSWLNILSLWALAQVDVHLGNYDRARASAQSALEMARKGGHYDGVVNALHWISMVAIAKAEYAQAHHLLQAGYPDLKDQYHDWVRLMLLGFAARGLGYTDQARRCIKMALPYSIGKFDSSASIMLPLIALLLLDEGQTERAIELYALASCFPFVANSRWFEEVAGKHIAAAAGALPPDVVAAAQERGRARDLVTTAKALLTELEADKHIR